MKTSRSRFALIAAVTLSSALGLSALLVQAPARAAATTGILNAKYGSAQVFDVQRSPAYPTCSDATTFNAFTVSSPNTPISEPVGSYDLGSNYLMVKASGDATYPWSIAMFNSSGSELRYNGSAWVTAPAGGFTTESPFTSKGKIFAAGPEGFLYESFGGTGTFFSTSGALPSGSLTYTPSATYNDCVSGQAIGKALDTLPVDNSPIAASTTTTITTTTLAPTLLMSDFAQPVDMPSKINTTKAGSTVPIKFRVTDGGTIVSNTAVVQSFASKTINCATLGSVTDPVEVTTTGGTSLRYDATAQQFVQNWKTPSGKGVCYQVTVTVSGGDSRTANFKTT